MTPVSDSRGLIVNALRQSLSGAEDAHDDAHVEQLFSNARSLTQVEKSALVQLYNWAKDSTLRAQFPAHAEYSRDRMRQLLATLHPQEDVA